MQTYTLYNIITPPRRSLNVESTSIDSTKNTTVETMVKKCFICECELPNMCRRFLYKGVRHCCASAELSWYEIRYSGISDEEMDQFWENGDFHDAVIALLTERGKPVQCPVCDTCFLAQYDDDKTSKPPSAVCKTCYTRVPWSGNTPDDAAVAKNETLSRAIQRSRLLGGAKPPQHPP